MRLKVLGIAFLIGLFVTAAFGGAIMYAAFAAAAYQLFVVGMVCLPLLSSDKFYKFAMAKGASLEQARSVRITIKNALITQALMLAGFALVGISFIYDSSAQFWLGSLLTLFCVMIEE